MGTPVTTRPASGPGRIGTSRRGFLGRPPGFGTLFVVDMWERFSFYGMQAILYLYLVAPPGNGGLGLSPGTGGALFGVYLSLVFMAALPGGWLADRVLGAHRAVLYGGVSIALGHYCMALPVDGSLYAGLLLIIVGTGLVKPAIAAMVGTLDGDVGVDEQREATFSFFYMSIQVSALVAPVVTGLLAERIDWHLGFGAAALGMTVGIVHYVLGMRHRGGQWALPDRPISPEQLRVVGRRAAWAVSVPAALLAADGMAGTFHVEHALVPLGLLTLAVPVAVIVMLRRRAGFDATQRRRLGAFTWLLCGAAVFWMLYAQGASVLGLFARDRTDRTVAGFEVPASWFQSAHPLFILLLAPLFAWLWVRGGGRVGVPVKFAGALVLAGASLALMSLAAVVAQDGRVSPGWLLAAYLLQVCGELALAPIGLGLAARVAPPGYVNQFLGMFWLFAAVGAALGAQLARLVDILGLPTYFLIFGLVATATGLGLALAAGRLRRALDATS